MSLPYSGTGAQVSYARELDGSGELAARPNYFTQRTGPVELSLQAEAHSAHRSIDGSHLAAQAQSDERWTAAMRSLHGQSHAVIEANRAARAASPPQQYVASPSSYTTAVAIQRVL